MHRYRLISWNVNGIRAAINKGLAQWLAQEQPDILAVQETKIQPEQIAGDLRNIANYRSYWSCAEKKGYSGVAVYSQAEPLRVTSALGIKKFDAEGRVLCLEYSDYFLLNIYFPNGKMTPDRLSYKLDFYAEFLKLYSRLKKSKKAVLVCGDVNTAHKEIDLARPKENSRISGFLPEERAFLDKFAEKGLVDTFREFNPEGGNYTWWDLKSRARARNVGWRIDYFYIDRAHQKNLKAAFILKDVTGSDHCPIGIEVAF